MKMITKEDIEDARKRGFSGEFIELPEDEKRLLNEFLRKRDHIEKKKGNLFIYENSNGKIIIEETVPDVGINYWLVDETKNKGMLIDVK